MYASPFVFFYPLHFNRLIKAGINRVTGYLRYSFGEDNRVHSWVEIISRFNYVLFL